jgi:formylglycine-generating enzyme required for sulfatase activity
MVSWYDAVEYCNWLSEREGLTPAYTINKNQIDPNNVIGSVDSLKWLVTWNKGADGYRLPTEAEWEYACRAGTTTTFNTERTRIPIGMTTFQEYEITTDQANYNGNYPYYAYENTGQYRETTVAVNSFSPNAWGLYNMHGNVMEWCWDWYAWDYYRDNEAAGPDPDGPDTSKAGSDTGVGRVNRGGSWRSPASSLRSAYRYYFGPPTARADNRGFRLVRGPR